MNVEEAFGVAIEASATLSRESEALTALVAEVRRLQSYEKEVWGLVDVLNSQVSEIMRLNREIGLVQVLNQALNNSLEELQSSTINMTQEEFQSLVIRARAAIAENENLHF